MRLPTQQTLFISDVLFVPVLAKNLISVAQITQTGHTTVTFTHNQCIIATKSPNSRQQTKYRLSKTSNMFTLKIAMEPGDSVDTTLFSQLPNPKTIKWHYRLGHLNIHSLSIMQSHDLVIGLPPIQSTLTLCEGCIFGKHSRNPYPTDLATRAIVPLV